MPKNQKDVVEVRKIIVNTCIEKRSEEGRKKVTCLSGEYDVNKTYLK